MTIPNVTTVSAATPNGAYKAGDTILIEVTFDRPVDVTGTPVLALSSGGSASYVEGGGGAALTFSYTVQAGDTAADLDYASTGALTLPGGASIKDAGGADDADLALPAPGGPGSLGAAAAIVLDTTAPTVAITAGAGALAAGQTTTLTFTFSEAPGASFTAADVAVSGGTLSGFDGSGTVYSATFTPSAAFTGAASVTVTAGSYADAAGNLGAGGATPTLTVDTQRPALASGIAISDTALKIGDTATVTFTFTEAVSGFTVDDVVVPNGALSDLASGDGITWTATLTPGTGVTDAANVLTLDYTGLVDGAGNAGSGTVSSGPYAVDTIRPSLASGIAISDTALEIGDTATVTFTFTEAVSGFTVDDVVVPNGALSDLASGDGGITWTATLTPAAGVSDATNVLTLDYTGVADAAGNAGSGSVSSGAYAVATLSPPTATVGLSDAALGPGETATITFTFSRAVTGFTLADVTAPNGALSNLTTADNITWTATFTPAAGVSDATNVITVDLTGVEGGAGNPGVGAATSANYTVATAPAPEPEPDPAPPAPPPVTVIQPSVPGGFGEIHGSDAGNLIDVASLVTTSGGAIVLAGGGADTVVGGFGTDYLHGGTGSDTVLAGAGLDTVRGGMGEDFLHGNVGDDVLFGDLGDDTLHGGQGADVVQGGLGADTLLGDLGDDVVRGGQGDDLILGGDGDDFISGDRGADTLFGGAGADTFHSFGAAGIDVIADFDAAQGDRLRLDPGTAYTVRQAGSDTLVDLEGGAQVRLVGVQLSSLPEGWIV
ncbi:Ig-like domain-containing protein [Phenylobacterium zucineum]|uniref:Ig-like domain-containing protein n=1 Tax=Phenylobacterium zucineum TaxID=284016 RepID=UPI0002E3CA84|nr:Ig-like domain-containing protein [Phenylobacterium zucineum]